MQEELSPPVFMPKTQKGAFTADIYCCPYGSDAAESETELLCPPVARFSFTREELDTALYAAIEKNPGASVGLGFAGLCYPKEESAFRLTEHVAEIIYDTENPLRIITRSELILHDTGLLSTVAGRTSVEVAVPIALNDALGAIFEQGWATPSFRFEMLSRLSSSGIRCGVLLAPMIPYVSDSGGNVRRIVSAAAKAGASFIYPDFGLLLPPSKKTLFFDTLEICYHGWSEFFSDSVGDYRPIPRRELIERIFDEECTKHGLHHTYNK